MDHTSAHDPAHLLRCVSVPHAPQGDMMHITAKNGGWWRAIKVSNPAEQGWVPSNYLSVVKADGGLEKVMVTPRTAAGQVRPETVVGAITMPQPSPSPQATAAAAFGFGADSATQLPATNGKPLLYGVRTLHRYTAAQADGLSFEAKELLSVIGTKDGWLRCVNAMGIEGWVPSNYTTQVERTDAAASSATTSAGAAGTSAAFPADSGDAGAGAGAVAAATASNLNFSKATASSSSMLDFVKPKTLDTSFGDESVVARKSAPPPMEESAGRSSAAPPQLAAEPSPVSMASPRPDLPPLDANMTPRVDPPTPRAPELPQDSYVATPRVHSGSGGGSGSDTPEEEYRDQVGDLTITPRMQQSIGSASERVRALYNFEPKKPDHLAFKKGDVLVVLKKKGQWYKCHHEHHTTRVGYIPANYVKAMVAADPIPNPTVLALTSTATGATATTVAVADFEPTKERPLLVKASHNYKALANNQISFSKHEMLHVIHKNKVQLRKRCVHCGAGLDTRAPLHARIDPAVCVRSLTFVSVAMRTSAAAVDVAAITAVVGLVEGLPSGGQREDRLHSFQLRQGAGAGRHGRAQWRGGGGCERRRRCWCGRWCRCGVFVGDCCRGHIVAVRRGHRRRHRAAAGGDRHRAARPRRQGPQVPAAEARRAVHHPRQGCRRRLVALHQPHLGRHGTRAVQLPAHGDGRPTGRAAAACAAWQRPEPRDRVR